MVWVPMAWLEFAQKELLQETRKFDQFLPYQPIVLNILSNNMKNHDAVWDRQSVTESLICPRFIQFWGQINLTSAVLSQMDMRQQQLGAVFIIK